MFENIYLNKRVFITGHTGFKGAWLSLWLQHLGARVEGYSLPPPNRPNLYEDTQLSKQAIFEPKDIRNYQQLAVALQQFQPDIIFHLAAQAIVMTGLHDPLDTFSTNIMGTANLLHAAAKVNSLKAIICITSDKCYENDEGDHAYVETDPLGGHDPYSASKACAEIVSHSMVRCYYDGNEAPERCAIVTTARAGNVIGGGDWADHRIIPDCIRAWGKEEPVILRNPSSVRPWQHVLEPLCGYLRLGQLSFSDTSLQNQAFNFGPNNAEAYTVEELVNAFGENMPFNAIECACGNTPTHAEAGMLKLNCEKAGKVLNWSPLLELNQAIEMTRDWYKLFLSCPSQIRNFTLGQIKVYEHLARSGR